MSEFHVSDYNLERYYLGMITADLELAGIEEHLLSCAACVERAEHIELFVDGLRSVLSQLDDLPRLDEDERPSVCAAGAAASFAEEADPTHRSLPQLRPSRRRSP